MPRHWSGSVSDLSVIYLTMADLMHIAERTLGQVQIADIGLLDSALVRPQASAFGEDAYPDLDHKAAALAHSLARNHGLVDGNKRLALAGLIAFYGLNGRRLSWTNGEAYDVFISIAEGELDDVESIVRIFKAATVAW